METIIHNKEFPKIIENENIGTILNSITASVISKYLNVLRVPSRKYLEFLKKQNITTVMIEDYIYETDNVWFDKEFDHLIEILKNSDITVIIVSTKDRIIAEKWSGFPSIIIDYELLSPSIVEDQIKLPLLLDETEFNPKDNTYENDITYFKVGNLNFPEEFSELHSKFKFKMKTSTPLTITSELISRLIDTIKKSKIIYIIDSENLDITFIKYIEIAAALQNTLVFIDSPRVTKSSYAYLVTDYKESADYIRALINNEMFMNKMLIKKSRQAFIEQTFICQNNNNIFCNKVACSSDKNFGNISVIVTTKRKENLKNLFVDLNNQEKVNLQVILLTHGYELDNSERKELNDMSEFELEILSEEKTTSFGNCLNKCIEYVKHDYVIKMDDDDFYFPHFIIDIYIGIKYTGAQIVGKNAFYFYLEEDNIVGQRRMDFQFKDVKEVKGNTIMCRTDTLKEYKFGDLKRHVDSDLIIRIREDGGRIYSIHPHDMCVYRAGDKSGHTYQVNDSRFLKDAHVLYYGKPNKTVSSE